MEVRISTEKPLSKELLAEISKEFGFECLLDHDEPGDMDYYVGYDPENVGVHGCCDEDPMPYDECVRLCGWLWKRGLEGWIEGNGAWAQGMISRTDFNDLATTDAAKREFARIAAIFWGEADPAMLPKILPNAKGHSAGRQENSES